MENFIFCAVSNFFLFYFPVFKNYTEIAQILCFAFEISGSMGLKKYETGIIMKQKIDNSHLYYLGHKVTDYESSKKYEF